MIFRDRVVQQWYGDLEKEFPFFLRRREKEKVDLGPTCALELFFFRFFFWFVKFGFFFCADSDLC